jgi:hypothetical protein
VIAQQENDTLQHKIAKDSLTQKLKSADLNQEIDNLKQELSYTTKNTMDSISILKKLIRTDSIKLDSLNDWYQRQQVRIKNYPQSKLEKINQLDTLKYSFEKKKAALYKEKAQHVKKIEETTSDFQTKINNWKAKLMAKLQPMDSLGLSGSDVSKRGDDIGGNLDMDNLSDQNINLPKVEIPEISSSLPELPDIKELTNNASLPTADVPDLDKLNPKELGLDLTFPEFEQAQKTFGELKVLNEKANSYKKDIDSLDRAKVEKRLEEEAVNRISNIEEVKALEKAKASEMEELKKVKEYQDMMRQYQDKEYITQQMEEKSVTLANDIMAKNVPKVKEAQQQVTKTQRKFKQFSSLDDARKHRFNSLHGKPFEERLYYGLTLQFQQNQYRQFFSSPFAYYKLTGRLSLGGGYTYRGQFQTKPRYEWITNERVYGPRAFLNIGIAKGIFLHTQGERLFRENELSGQWSNHCMVGLGRNFRLGKRIGGEALLLYNPLQKSDDIYTKQINVRTSILFGKAYK